MAVQNETQAAGTKLPIVEFIRGGLSDKWTGKLYPI